VPSIIEKAINALERASAWVVQRCAGLPRHSLAWGSIALALILLLSVNLFASSALRNAKADLTQQRLFTISPGTRLMLSSIDEPISIKLYYSPRLREVAPTYGRYFERVRALLRQYRDISRGKLDLAVFDPEPFSDAEDRAVAAGLRGIRINQEGETAYFGLVGSNATDNDVTVPFFTADREPFLEYDLTKLVYTLANPKKRVVGFISGLPLDGGMNPMAMMGGGPRTLPAQMVMEQIRDFFEVKTLAQDLKEIPSDLDLLMVVQPERLTAQAAYAIDQFVLGGGKLLAFLDPVAEAGATPMGMGPAAAVSPELLKLMKAWGVEFDPGKAVGDIASARRVQFGGGSRPVVTEYVAWLGLDRSNMDEKDVLFGGIEKLNLASAGFFTPVQGATTHLLPILESSPQAMQIAADKLQMVPDPVGLLRAYKPEGKRLILAARLSGEAHSAFPEGAPKPEPKPDAATASSDKGKGDKPEGAKAGTKAEAAAADKGKGDGAPAGAGPTPEGAKAGAKAEATAPDKGKGEGAPAGAAAAPKPEGAKAGAKAEAAAADKGKGDEAGPSAPPAGAAHRVSGRVNAILVADTDMLADQFWVDVRDFLGQQVAIPNAGNAAFVVNALDNLSGSEALIQLRGRGTDERPFQLVNELRRDAERRYREKEQVLTTKLKEVQDQLAKYESSGEGNVILSESDRQAIDRFRADMLTIRRELREVKRALRQDIDRLDGWLRFANIGLVPMLIGAGGVGWVLLRRRRGGAHARPQHGEAS
jgi:ABC-type uncharacterized transport system involved in gliding motility auxiliary subunit